MTSFLSALGQQVETLNYDIVKGGKNIGYLVVSQSIFDDSTVYNIESHVEIRFLFSFAVHFKSREVSFEGVLDHGKAKSTLNGNVQKESEVWMDQNDLKVILNGSLYDFGERKADYFVSELYFKEPGKSREVFSQQFAQGLTLEKTGAHRYTLYSPDGNNYYEYESNRIKEVKVSRDFATFYFRLKSVN